MASRDGVSVSYAWNSLRNARIEQRLGSQQSEAVKAYYFTADVADPQQPEKASQEGIAILLEGFEMPAEEIGKLMMERAGAVRT